MREDEASIKDVCCGDGNCDSEGSCAGSAGSWNSRILNTIVGHGMVVSERGGKHCARSAELDSRLVALPNSHSCSQYRSNVDVDAL